MAVAVAVAVTVAVAVVAAVAARHLLLVQLSSLHPLQPLRLRVDDEPRALGRRHLEADEREEAVDVLQREEVRCGGGEVDAAGWREVAVVVKEEEAVVVVVRRPVTPRIRRRAAAPPGRRPNRA